MEGYDIVAAQYVLINEYFIALMQTQTNNIYLYIFLIIEERVKTEYW